MKVNIDKTVQVSDEQRKQIAAFLGDSGSKRRDATRDEVKEFIWRFGSSWESVLAGDEDEGEDLIGGDTEEDLI